MCIRDSPEREFARTAASGLAVGQTDWQATLVEVPDLAPGCLLYTSDAADDLPCVDLGGRRIIKKNKHYAWASMRCSSAQSVRHSTAFVVHH